MNTKPVKNVYRGIINNREIILVDKENGGKADGLNVGINYSKYPIFVAIDADSVLESESIKKIVSPFMKNINTVAVGGNIKISNYITIKDGKVVKKDTPKNVIVAFQIVEYLRSFLSSRMTWDKMNMNLIISGAFGAFNKSVIIEMGGYQNNTIGEDMELVMRIHKKYLKSKKPYYIAYAPDAICYTQAPNSLQGLKTQRKRWQIGLIHSMSLHKNMFLNYKWFLAKAYFFLFEMVTPIVELIGMITVPITFLLGVINIDFLLLYFFLMFVYGFVISLTSILLDTYAFKNDINKKEMVILILSSLFEPLGYRQIISLYRIYAFIGYKKNKHSWGSIKRTKNN
ncbi:MAG: glycosyltransferase family 2 protein [Romboutsia sp.]|nr:glycosyltransferase family 2 protein [Romboutsia sp.]